MLRLLSFLFLVSAFFSCLPEKTALERALREAGDNRMELEKVLAYYRDDTLKYQAACFLIENMPDQYAVLPLDSTDTYARALLSLDKEDPVSWEISRSLVAAVFDSISKIQPESRIKIVRDIEVMTSDYLIENIESAFKVWNRRGHTSMCQDVLAGRPTEVDLFAGTMLKIAKKEGFSLPVNTFLYEKLKELEGAPD